MSALPEKIGKYEVEGLLGKGAMGAVYRCRDPLMGRTVAVKRFLLSEHLDPEQGEEFRARFFQEARIAGALRHPNIVTVHDADVAGGVPSSSWSTWKAGASPPSCGGSGRWPRPGRST